MTRIGTAALVAMAMLLLWQAVVSIWSLPPYILPGPMVVLTTLIDEWSLIGEHALTTMLEIVLGLLLGTAWGLLSALLMARSRRMHRWMMPALVISQALPVFALAPILVLWLGYGIASKVAMAFLIIYFPVTAACYDGLSRTNPGWIELARSLRANNWMILTRVRFPAALPAIASGLRIATSVAPIGAVVGEWVGSSRGLGYLMLHANGRMQVDLMFAALLVLAVFTVTLYFTVDALLAKLLHWQPRTIGTVVTGGG
ncbi:MAG: ABC transporter permease [Gammaproteobacteria bacterium]|nr:ABC transporter permease [Gammaproteobacteria bacterium]